jgi:hypothetical protein
MFRKAYATSGSNCGGGNKSTGKKPVTTTNIRTPKKAVTTSNIPAVTRKKNAVTSTNIG